MEQENTELFTVSQFALQVGKTSQAIYQQAKGKLKPYVRKGKGGQVYITADALKLYEEKQTSQPATLDKDIQALQSEVNSLKAENERLQDRITDLQGQLAREQEISRERLERAEKAEQRSEAADRRIDNLLDKIPPMLPAGNAGGGLFGWLKRKKGDTNT